MKRKVKAKKCKNKDCAKEFMPKNLQCYCSPQCAPKKERTPIKKKVYTKESKCFTSNDLRNLLRIVFNAYIRERDKGKACISCNKVLTENYDAGHFYCVSSYPNLQFNELNVHGQCKNCNQFKDGNIEVYRRNLINRIGSANFERLELAKQKDILKQLDFNELIVSYREKTLKLKAKELTI